MARSTAMVELTEDDRARVSDLRADRVGQDARQGCRGGTRGPRSRCEAHSCTGSRSRTSRVSGSPSSSMPTTRSPTDHTAPARPSTSGAGILTLTLEDSAALPLAIRTGRSLACVSIFGKAAGIFP
jgi:hypothetical protein